MTIDQESADSAQKLILKLINDNKQIESRIWISVLISTFIYSYKISNYPFSELRKDVSEALSFYEKIWDGENI